MLYTYFILYVDPGQVTHAAQCPHTARTFFSEVLRGCKQIRYPMSCDGDDDNDKKIIITTVYTVLLGTVRGCSILPATAEPVDP